MSELEKNQFSKALGQAIKASLTAVGVSDGLRARLDTHVRDSTQAPSALSLEALTHFQNQLQAAIHTSLGEQAPNEARILSIELALIDCQTPLSNAIDTTARATNAQELKNSPLKLERLSERALRAQLAKLGADSSIRDHLGPRARWIHHFDQAVSAATQQAQAPASCQGRILQALALQAGSTNRNDIGQNVLSNTTLPPARPTLYSLKPPETCEVAPPLKASKVRSFWKRGLAAVASLAACTILLWGTLVGSSQRALADSVRRDHTHCCQGLKGATTGHCASLKNSAFGPLPPSPVNQEWTLVASKMCEDQNDQPMIHNVYTSHGKTLSIHFIPSEKTRFTTQAITPQEIAAEGFPVFAWCCKGWTITACSEDLSADQLNHALVATP